MKVEVSISCLNDDIYKVVKNINATLGDEKLLIHVVHQVSNNENYSEVIDEFIKISNLRYSRIEQIGLPASRNFALINTLGDYLIPTDADVMLVPNFVDLVLDSFAKNSDCDFLTFQSYHDVELQEPRLNYKKNSFIHTQRSLLSVSSIDLVINVNSFKRNNVFWDNDFGIGAKYSGGLETVMLQNAHSAKLIGRYLPIPLSIHPEKSSGQDVSLERVSIRTAVFVRIFGKFKGLLLTMYFHFIKNKIFIESFGRVHVLRKIYKTISEY